MRLAVGLLLTGAASGLSITCDAEYGKLCASTPGEALKVAECLKAQPSGHEGISLGCSAWMAVVSACGEELEAGGACSDASMPDAFLCLSAWKSSQISGECKKTVDQWAARASSGGGGSGGGSTKPRKRKKSRAKQKRAAYKQAVKEAAERKKAEARKKKRSKKGKRGKKSKKKREL